MYCSRSVRPSQVWDMNVGDFVMQLARDKPLTDVAVAPDGQLAAVASLDGNCCIWDLDSGQVRTVAFGTWAAARCGPGAFGIWTAAGCGLLRLGPGHRPGADCCVWDLGIGQVWTWRATVLCGVCPHQPPPPPPTLPALRLERATRAPRAPRGVYPLRHELAVDPPSSSVHTLCACATQRAPPGA
eukprot:347723-Chlamydomonas_euryale.AAC.1